MMNGNKQRFLVTGVALTKNDIMHPFSVEVSAVNKNTARWYIGKFLYPRCLLRDLSFTVMA